MPATCMDDVFEVLSKLDVCSGSPNNNCGFKDKIEHIFSYNRGSEKKTREKIVCILAR